MTPLERAARAICARRMLLQNDPFGLRLPPEIWQQAHAQAEAALSAVHFDELLAAARGLAKASRERFGITDWRHDLEFVLAKIDKETKDAG